jgi:FAD/FMN-containing dehydrogenase
LTLARERLGGDLTAFEVMWNSYYRITLERVLRVAAPLPVVHPFYVLLEVSGTDADRARGDLERLLGDALGAGLIRDATIAISGAYAAALWRIRDSSVEMVRTLGPSVAFDISLAIARMEDFAEALNRRLETLDKESFAVIFGHAGDGNLHVTVAHGPAPELRDQVQDLVYALTGEFAGSISAEHGIGILKRPFLKLSRTEEEIETMRTLKSALDPHHILNPGRIFSLRP